MCIFSKNNPSNKPVSILLDIHTFLCFDKLLFDSFECLFLKTHSIAVWFYSTFGTIWLCSYLEIYCSVLLRVGDGTFYMIYALAKHAS